MYWQAHCKPTLYPYPISAVSFSVNYQYLSSCDKTDSLDKTLHSYQLLWALYWTKESWTRIVEKQFFTTSSRGNEVSWLNPWFLSIWIWVEYPTCHSRVFVLWKLIRILPQHQISCMNSGILSIPPTQTFLAVLLDSNVESHLIKNKSDHQTKQIRRYAFYSSIPSIIKHKHHEDHPAILNRSPYIIGSRSLPSRGNYQYYTFPCQGIIMVCYQVY